MNTMRNVEPYIDRNVTELQSQLQVLVRVYFTWQTEVYVFDYCFSIIHTNLHGLETN